MTSPSPHTCIHCKPIKIWEVSSSAVCVCVSSHRVQVTSRMLFHKGAWHFHFYCGVKCYLTSGLSHLDTSLRLEREHTPHTVITHTWLKTAGPFTEITNKFNCRGRKRQTKVAALVFQQSLDDNKNNNDPERTFGLTHTHTHTLTMTHTEHATHVILLLLQLRCSGMIQFILHCCLRTSVCCTLGCRLNAWKRRYLKKKKKKHIFTEHHCHCHWAVSLKREGRSKASGAMASGGGDSPRWRGEGQSLSELPHPPLLLLSPPIAYFQPNLGFVHLVLWSRLQTSCPNFTCHSHLYLL